MTVLHNIWLILHSPHILYLMACILLWVWTPLDMLWLLWLGMQTLHFIVHNSYMRDTAVQILGGLSQSAVHYCIKSLMFCRWWVACRKNSTKVDRVSRWVLLVMLKTYLHLLMFSAEVDCCLLLTAVVVDVNVLSDFMWNCTTYYRLLLVL